MDLFYLHSRGTYRTVVAAGDDVDCFAQAGEVYRRLIFLSCGSVKLSIFLTAVLTPAQGCRHGMKE